MVCLLFPTNSSSNCCQTFTIDDVEPPDPTIDWQYVKENKVSIVQGSGQTVNWRGSNVTVYEKNAEGTEVPTLLRNVKKGQLKLSAGMRLYITEGKYTAT